MAWAVGGAAGGGGGGNSVALSFYTLHLVL